MNDTSIQSAAVLVIEDNPLEAQIVTHFVERHGGFAVTTECPKTAQAMIDAVHFDLITVDLQLSGSQNGIDFVNSLKLYVSDKAVSTDLVVLTGTELSKEEHASLFTHGFVDVMYKPFDPGRLVAYLDKIVERRRSVCS